LGIFFLKLNIFERRLCLLCNWNILLQPALSSINSIKAFPQEKIIITNLLEHLLFLYLLTLRVVMGFEARIISQQLPVQTQTPFTRDGPLPKHTFDLQLKRSQPGYFLTRPNEIFLTWRGKIWKIWGFLWEIFQTQTKDGWPNTTRATKNWPRLKIFDLDPSLPFPLLQLSLIPNIHYYIFLWYLDKIMFLYYRIVTILLIYMNMKILTNQKWFFILISEFFFPQKLQSWTKEKKHQSMG